MYRKFSKESIVKYLDIYQNYENIDFAVHTNHALTQFFLYPASQTLVDVLYYGEKEVVMMALSALNCALNFTSLRPFLTDKNTLMKIVENLDIEYKLIYTLEQCQAIRNYTQNKGKKAENYEIMQCNDVVLSLNKCGITSEINTKKMKILEKNEVRANGVLILSTDETVIVYLRYGSSVGGNQNKGVREMFNIAKMNPDHKFLFVYDGFEVYHTWGIATSALKTGNFENALWVTKKLLNQVNFSELKLS